MYDLDLDWNSSGIHQLKGRIHRQGNRFKFVRFVVPYVQNTLDSFIAQKNYEKNERIKSLLDKSDDLNEKNVSDEIDLMEIRFQLISDKKELYNVKYQIEHEKASKKLALYHQRLTAFEDGKKAVIKFLRTEMEMRELFNDKFIQFERYYEGLYNYFNDVIKNKVLKERFEKVKKSFDDFLESINEILDFYRLFIQKEDYKALSRFKNAIISRKLVFSYEPLNDGYIIEVDASTIYYKYHYSELYQNNRDLKVFVNNYYRIHDRFNEFQAELSAVQKFERDILRPYQKSFRDDFDDILIDLTINREQALKLTEYIESDDFYEESIIKIEDTLIERNEQLGDIQDRVDDFTSLNYLLSYPFEEKTADQCELPINTDEGKSERDKFQKERNKKNEDGDIEEGSERATRKKLRKIKDFFNKSQYKVVSANIMEFEEPIHRLFETISKMPVTYETESIEGNEKIACLHYFYGGTDIYIIELDKGDEEDTDDMFQAQTFGWTILNDDFEMSDYGYISIDEIKKHFELDFYFTPKKMAQIIDSHNPYLKKTKNDNDIDEVEYQEEEEENEDFDEEEQEAIKLQEESVRLINQEINLLNMKIENWESELEFVDSESEFKALKLIIKINNVRLQKLNASIEDKFEFGGCICKMN